MKTNHYQLLVFDWDGTLIDSIERITTSLQAASKKTFSKVISAQQARDVIGLGLSEALEQLHPDLNNSQIEYVATEYKQHFLYENSVNANLFEGVIGLLDDLKTTGYQLAIATGKSRPGLERALNEFNLAHYFVTTRCAGENISKPHPEMLNQITDETGIEKSRTLMIGDSEHDLLMATNANVDSIGVIHGVHNKETLNRHKPLTCLDKVTDLSDFLAHN